MNAGRTDPPSWLDSLVRGDVESEFQNGYTLLRLPNDKEWFNSVKLLMQRDCYVTTRNKLFGSDDNHDGGVVYNNRRRSFMLVEGKAGVGKSCFLAWLIYDIFRRAVEYRNINDWKNDKVNEIFHSPVIMYSLRDTTRWILELDKEPHNIIEGEYKRVTYIFSDDVDVGGAEVHEQVKLVLVTASDPSTKLKQYRNRAAEATHNYSETFFLLNYNEAAAMFVNTFSEEELKFRFDAVNGNPRFLGWNQRNLPHVRAPQHKLLQAINTALETVFGKTYIVPLDSVTTDLTENQRRGCWLMQSIVERAGTDAEKDVRKSSLFLQYLPCMGIVNEIETFSSKFMEILSGIISEEENTGMIDTLKKIFGASGVGCSVEYLGHRNIVDGHKRWFAIPVKEDVPHHNSILELPFEYLYRHHLRNVSEISTLPNNGYGIPTIANFPVVDSVVRVGNCLYFLQITTAKSHPIVVNEWDEIIKYAKTLVGSSLSSASASSTEEGAGALEMVFIWVLCDDNFEEFRGDNRLHCPQYKMKYSHQTLKDLSLKRKRLPSTEIEIRKRFAAGNNEELLKEFDQIELLAMKSTIGITRKTFRNKLDIIQAIRDKFND